MSYKCPLCNQDVSKQLYEKITGIWEAKEKVLLELKKKEKELKERFEKEKKAAVIESNNKLKLDFNKKIRILEKQRKSLERKFSSDLAKEVSKIKKQETHRMKQIENSLKERFSLDAQRKITIGQREILKKERIMNNKYTQLNRQFVAFQTRSKNELEQKDKKILSLSEQIQKNQTPQVLGLLEESRFVEELKAIYPNDKIAHPGKGGDVLQHIVENGKEIGLIVYELKKVSTGFKSAHLEQAYDAKQQRNADYGILVTNAKPPKKKAFGFFVQKGIVIIHPAGVFALVDIIRSHIVSISRLKLSKEKRNKMIDAVLDYIQAPEFRNGLNGIIEDTIKLYESMKKEVKLHIETWQLRFAGYRSINHNANTIKRKAADLILDNDENKQLVVRTPLSPIELPQKID